MFFPALPIADHISPRLRDEPHRRARGFLSAAGLHENPMVGEPREGRRDRSAMGVYPYESRNASTTTSEMSLTFTLAAPASFRPSSNIVMQ